MSASTAPCGLTSPLEPMNGPVRSGHQAACYTTLGADSEGRKDELAHPETLRSSVVPFDPSSTVVTIAIFSCLVAAELDRVLPGQLEQPHVLRATSAPRTMSA